MNDQHTTPQAHAIGLVGANKRKRETEPAVGDIKRICAQQVAQNAALNEGDMDVDQVTPVKTELDDIMDLPLEVEGTHCLDHIPDVFKQKGNQMRTLGLTLQRLEESSVEAEVKILTYKKEVANLEKQRKSFCAIERNASSKEILQEDFRNGLEQIELDEELEGNSDRSEPRPNQNHDTIMLSVFTCSARDYTQMTTRLDNYGETACFINPADTEIPALQDRCHSLATRAREQAVSSLASNLVMLLKSIEEFLRDADGIDIHDCRNVSDKWSSEVLVTEDRDGLGLAQTLPAAPSPDTTHEPRKTRTGRRVIRRSTTPLEDAFEQKVQQARILDRNQRAMQQRRADKGISHLLQKRMNTVALKCQKHLQSEFRNKIRSPCQAGAITAKNTATKTMEDSTQKMRWNTVKAVLRRYGEYKEVDLNTELARPMTQRITRPWSRVFEQNGLMLLHQMATASKEIILDLLKEVEGSSPPSLRARFQAQCHLAYQEAEKSIDNIVENLGVLIQREQKSISRSLVPYIKTELRDTYTEIIEASGTGAGSGNRLKQNLQDRVDHHRSHLFFDTCENMARKLDRLAEGLGVMVRVALCELSDKIEVNIATVWDTPLSSANDSANKDGLEWKEELAIRGDVSAKVRAMLSQLNTLVQPNDGAA
ncbi:unnamed protein product [Rhizoctonia solani]|uniref:DUF7605 domain-containing protein n=1 Tax=Rhizoctonia solani TaxID=456999 RepID=A0A8H3BEL8_9AGAM|nr:unnamed protein product [Rhizoctonia solani]